MHTTKWVSTIRSVCAYLHLGLLTSPTPLRGGGQLHLHFPSMEIAIPQAEHFWSLLFLGDRGTKGTDVVTAEPGNTGVVTAEPGAASLFFGFAEPRPGRGFTFLFGLAGCRTPPERGDLGSAGAEAAGGGTVLVGPPFLLPERRGFDHPWSSQQSLTSLAVGWVRPQ